MAIILFYIRNLAAAILMSASVYLAVIFLLRVIDEEDKALFNRVVRTPDLFYSGDFFSLSYKSTMSGTLTSPSLDL